MELAPDKLRYLDERTAPNIQVSVRIVLTGTRHVEKRDGGKKDFSIFYGRAIDKDGHNCGFQSFVFGTRSEREKALGTLTRDIADGSCWTLSKILQVQPCPGQPFTHAYMIRHDTGRKKSLAMAPLLDTVELPRFIEPSLRFKDLPGMGVGRCVDVCAFIHSATDQGVTSRGPKVKAVLVDEDEHMLGFGAWRDTELGETLLENVGGPIFIYNVWADFNESGTLKELTNQEAEKGVPTTTRIPEAGGGGRADALRKRADELKALDAPLLTAEYTTAHDGADKIDYLKGDAVETTIFWMASAAASQAQVDDTLFQIRNVTLQFSPGDVDLLRTKDQKRLFPTVTATDHTHSMRLKLSGKVALELTDCATEEDFEAAAKAGALTFNRCLLRITRKLQTSDKQNWKPSSLAITMAGIQGFVDVVGVAQLTTFASPISEGLAYIPANSRFVPCSLGQLQPSSLGGLAVNLAGSPVPVSGALVLLKGTRNPTTLPRAGGFAVRNANVLDLGSDKPEEATTVSTVTLAPTELLVTFSLDKGKTVLALVTSAMNGISGALEEVLVASMWAAPSEQAVEAFKAEMTSVAKAAQTDQRNRKRKAGDSAQVVLDYHTPSPKKPASPLPC